MNSVVVFFLLGALIVGFGTPGMYRIAHGLKWGWLFIGLTVACVIFLIVAIHHHWATGPTFEGDNS